MTNEEKLEKIQELAYYASNLSSRDVENSQVLEQILQIAKEKHEDSNVGGSDPVDDSAWGSFRAGKEPV